MIDNNFIDSNVNTQYPALLGELYAGTNAVCEQHADGKPMDLKGQYLVSYARIGTRPRTNLINKTYKIRSIRVPIKSKFPIFAN